jgi:hypothetical protein
MLKLKWLLLFLVAGGVVLADTSSLNLAIPTSPQNFQSDRIRAGDLECSHAIGSATNLEFGVVGILNDNNPFNNGTNNVFVNPNMNYSNEFVRDVGVYAKITIPIGAPKERLNCNILYQLELEKKRLEVIKLKQEIDRLRNLQFEN